MKKHVGLVLLAVAFAAACMIGCQTTKSVKEAALAPGEAHERAPSQQKMQTEASNFDQWFQYPPPTGIDFDKYLERFFGEPVASTSLSGLSKDIVSKFEQTRSLTDVYELILPYAQNWGATKAAKQNYFQLTEGLFSARRELRKFNSAQDRESLKQTIYLLEALAEETLYAIRLKYPNDSSVWQKTYIDSKTAKKYCIDSAGTARTNQLQGYKADLCPGDIVLSKGGAGSSSFLARITEYPGNFSHSAVIYIEPTKAPLIGKPGDILLPEAFIEDGVKVRDPLEQGYAGNPPHKKRMFFYRSASIASEAKTIISSVDSFMATAKAKVSDARKDASYEYDFGFDPEDHSKLFCSEVAYDIYQDATKRSSGLSNPYDLSLWGKVGEGAPQDFMKNVLGIARTSFPSPSDLELNPAYDLVGFSINLAELSTDRVDVALVDTLLMLLKSRPEILKKYSQSIAGIGNDPVQTDKAFAALEAAGFLSSEKAKALKAKIAGKVPSNINLKQLVFFGYLNEVLTPKVRQHFAAAIAGKTADGRMGLNQLRAEMRSLLEGEIAKMQSGFATQ